MNSFKKSLDFFAKNFLLIIPLFVAAAIPMLIMGNLVAQMVSIMTRVVQSALSGNMEDPTELMQTVMGQTMGMMGSSSLGSGLSFILTVLATPITYGLLKRALNNRPAGLQNSLDALKETFVPYIIYAIGTFILAIVAAIAYVLAILIIGLILSLLGTTGMVLTGIIGVGIAVVGFYFIFRLEIFWFPAMLLDGKSVMDGLKHGFATTKGSFWPLFGITILVLIAIGIASGILFFLTSIPVIGPLISAAISTVGAFVLMIFYLTFYLEKTQGAATPPPQDA